MTEYWPCLLAAVCAIAVLRCAARQRHGMRSLLAGAVCGLGALARALFRMIGSYDSTLSAATTSMRYAIYAFSNYLPIVLNVGMFLIFRGFDLEEKLPAMRAEVAKRRTQTPEE